MIRKYGRDWPLDTELEVELQCFYHDITPEQGGLGKAEHFWKIVGILWPAGGMRPLIRNPWSDKMIYEACRWQFLAVSGPASATKTEMFAAWGIVNYLAAPLKTMVLVTSTSLKESRKRIWGAIRDLWLFSAVELWGKVVDSTGIIRAEFDDVKGSDRCGIALISGERKRERESIGKLIGIKQENVILVGDELAELSEALIEAGVANLQSNPRFQFVGISNPASRYDPHGKLSKPKKGWSSITDKDYEWETELGYAIRFDAEQSPNILAGKVLFPFLPTKEKLEKAKRELGENSLSYWRMWRGFWCPEGSTEGIYQEADITQSCCEERTVNWMDTPVPCAGLDLGFTTDGDETRLQFGLLGKVRGGPVTLLVEESLALNDDTRVKKPRNEQIAELVMKECQRRGVKPQHLGIDTTGGGLLFAEMLSRIWHSNEFHKVTFGGQASEEPIMANNPKRACDAYYNRVSELWGVGLSYLHSGQIKGITPELAIEMCSRKQMPMKKNGEVVLKVESKYEVKKRTQTSPDRADAFFVLLDTCRQKLKFRAIAVSFRNKAVQQSWGMLVETTNDAMTTPQVGQSPGRVAPKRIGRPGFTPSPIKIIGGGWGAGSFLH